MAFFPETVKKGEYSLMWGVLGARGAEFTNLPKSGTDSKTWTQGMRGRERNLLDPAPPVDKICVAFSSISQHVLFYGLAQMDLSRGL